MSPAETNQKKRREKAASITALPDRAAGGLTWGLGALLVVMTVVAYLPVTRCGYIWDDDMYIHQNVDLKSVGGLGRIWSTLGTTPQYYPLVFTSYWLEFRVWGLNPAGFHVVNVLLHAAGALLLWRILVLLRVRGAWLGAALFALHPVNVESVAWITERKNVLSGVFYFGAAMLYLRGALGPGGRMSARRYAVFLVLFVCALLSKTVTSTLPAAILLVLWWKKERLGMKDVLALVPPLILGIAGGALTAWMEKGHVGAVGEDWDFSILDRCLIAGRVICFYAYKLVWPHPLIFSYPRWQIDTAIWWQFLFPLIVIEVVAGLWLLRRQTGRGPLVGVLFFIGTLFPALGFFNVYPMRFSFVADHFQYLACSGMIALIAATGYAIAERGGRGVRRIAVVPAVAALAILGVLTWHQCRIYKDEEMLWRATLAGNPDSWIAHNNLVSILVPQRKDDEAEWHCQEVLRLRPDCAEAYFNRGLLRLAQGRLDETVGCFRQAVELIPEAANMHVGLGGALLAQGRTDEAIAEYRQALRLKPDDFQTHLHIGAALQMQGKLDEAVAYYRRALSLDPTDAQTHNDISIALMLQGQSAEAVTHCRAALKIRPDWVDPMLRIASILATHPEAGLGKPEEAVRLAKRAADLTQHSDVQVQNILATAYAAAGQFDQAIATVEAALQLESALSKDKETADGMRRKVEAYRQGRLPADRPGSAGPAAP